MPRLEKKEKASVIAPPTGKVPIDFAPIAQEGMRVGNRSISLPPPPTAPKKFLRPKPAKAVDKSLSLTITLIVLVMLSIGLSIYVLLPTPSRKVEKNEEAESFRKKEATLVAETPKPTPTIAPQPSKETLEPASVVLATPSPLPTALVDPEVSKLEKAYANQDSLPLAWYLYLQKKNDTGEAFQQEMAPIKKLDKKGRERLQTLIAPYQNHADVAHRLFYEYVAGWLRIDPVTKPKTQITRDVVKHKDGRTLVGKITKETQDAVEIEVQIKTMTAKTSIAKADLLSRKEETVVHPNEEESKEAFNVLLSSLVEKDYVKAKENLKFLKELGKKGKISFFDDLHLQRFLVWQKAPELMFQFAPPLLVNVEKLLDPLKICTSCHGTTKVECKTCSGEGFVACVDCKGEGKKRITEIKTSRIECPTCSGKGKISHNIIDLSGQGDRRYHSRYGYYEYRYDYNGRRILRYYSPYSNRYSDTSMGLGTNEVIICQTCNGTGKYDDKFKVTKQIVCNLCKGSGKKSPVCSSCQGAKFLLCKPCQSSGWNKEDAYTRQFLSLPK